MNARASITTVSLCLCAVLALAPTTSAASIPVVVTATAFEVGGTEPDVFSLTYTCDCDIRILQFILDMTPSAGHLFFDTFPVGGPGWDFTVLPDAFFPGFVSTATVFQYASADGSPQLLVQFTSFRPGDVLYFDIDVDGPTSTTFTAADFAGTSLGIIFDPSPAFPGALPYGAVFTFIESDGQAFAFGGRDIPVPEPATVALVGTGVLALFGVIRRRRMS